MKVFVHLLAGTLLLLLCVSGVSAQTPWFEDFNAGPVNAYVGAPWESTVACAMLNGVGYFGSIGVRGYAGGWTQLARMYRAGGGTNAYVVWKVYLGVDGGNGRVEVSLTPTKTTEPTGIGYTGTWLSVTQASELADYEILMMSFSDDGSGSEVATRIYLTPNLTRGWYEFKLEAVGLQVSSYYREPGAATWNLIGTQTQVDGFAPTYVGAEVGYYAYIDDIGFNSESHPTGSLKSHITLQNYLPVTACPVAVGVQLTKSGVPMAPVNTILDASGDLVIEDLPYGTYEAAYTAVGFLRNVITPVVITGGQETLLPVTMINGDFNGDSHITSADMSGMLGNIDLSGD